MGTRLPTAPAAFACAGFALAAVLLVTGCAVPVREPATAAATHADQAFESSGRFSARRDQEGVAGQFAWTHDGERDVLVLSTPTGQALARMSGDAGSVAVEFADGRQERAQDWERLTERVLGVPIPVRGLAYWIRALPHPGSAHLAEPDPQGRTSVLRQDGWEIVYGYRDGADPARLRMSYPGVELRLAIDERSSSTLPQPR
jgi:outer membrane lipoprotein LolB